MLKLAEKKKENTKHVKKNVSAITCLAGLILLSLFSHSFEVKLKQIFGLSLFLSPVQNPLQSLLKVLCLLLPEAYCRGQLLVWNIH